MARLDWNRARRGASYAADPATEAQALVRERRQRTGISPELLEISERNARILAKEYQQDLKKIFEEVRILARAFKSKSTPQEREHFKSLNENRIAFLAREETMLRSLMEKWTAKAEKLREQRLAITKT